MAAGFQPEAVQIPANDEKRAPVDFQDYHGEVDVVHFLALLRDEIGFDVVAKKVSRSLKMPLEKLDPNYMLKFQGINFLIPLRLETSL